MAEPTVAGGPEGTAPEYVLGTHADELTRLGFQHRLWSDAAHALWKRAGVLPGQRVLDVGCGPGFAAFDLAQLVGPGGSVLGVDESPGFVASANTGAAARGLTWCHAVTGDVQAMDLPPASIDLAWARWVLCFTPDPEAVVAGIAHAVRPGGRVCLHDYFNYEVMTLAPRSPAFTEVVGATARSWRARGGDPDVMARVPAMLRRQGFEVTHLDVHQRVARPGESMWHWGESWWRNYVPRLVEMGEISPDLAERFFADFEQRKADPDAFIVLPPVFEVLATRG